MNLKQIHCFEKGKFIYRLINQELPNNFENLRPRPRQRASYNLRSNNNGDVKERFSRTNYGYKRIETSGAKLWNNIPTTIKHSESLNIFAERYKKHLLSDQSVGEQSTEN